MPNKIASLPRNVRRFLGQKELREIEANARRTFSERLASGHYRMSEAATVTYLSDLLDPAQRPYAIEDIEGLHSVTGEAGGRGAAMETLAQLEGLGITEGFGGKVKEKFR